MANEDLNQEQLGAVEAQDGPVLIVAGPGTGKTKTLTARVVRQISSGKAKPAEILALTFTKKAAEEMQGRIGKTLQRAGCKEAPRVLTFHALSHEILGRELRFVEDAARLQLIKSLSKPLPYKGFSTRELGLLISRCKNMAEDNPELKKLTAAYDNALAEQGVVDFDDLLVKAREELGQDQAKRQLLQQSYKYVLVDEFQDTNLLQYQFLKLLLGHDNLFVIGDPNQSIYGFRGASSSIFEQFRQDFPGCTEVNLTANYRSAPEVVALGNAVFTSGPKLTAFSATPGRVSTIEVLNEYSEANWVLGEIQRALGGGDFLHTVSDSDCGTESSLRDFAVLYRNRSAAVAVQKAVADSGLPYQVVGEGSPYDRPQVQTIVALLRACTNGEATPYSGFTDNEWRSVLDVIQPTQSTPHLLAEKIIATLGYDYDTALQQFVGSLVRFPDLVSAIGHFEKISKQNYYDAQADAVTLLTIHASKGLEFKHVFLVGAEEGVLPHPRCDADEERRLFYVAATRAKQSFDILHAQKRGGKPALLSRFVTGLPDNVANRTVDCNLQSDRLRAKKRAAKRSQQSLF